MWLLISLSGYTYCLASKREVWGLSLWKDFELPFVVKPLTFSLSYVKNKKANKLEKKKFS